MRRASPYPRPNWVRAFLADSGRLLALLITRLSNLAADSVPPSLGMPVSFRKADPYRARMAHWAPPEVVGSGMRTSTPLLPRSSKDLMFCGFPSRVRITATVRAKVPLSGKVLQSVVMSPSSINFVGSISVAKIATWAGAPALIWLKMCPEPAKEVTISTSSPWVCRYHCWKAGITSFLKGSSMAL